MKALEKDRNRRYETATGFAQDIQKYLADEPVLACPPSAGYNFRKFARKHRKALATAAAFIVLLVAGVVVSTWQAIRATQAEAAAKANAEQAERNAQQALDEAKAKATALVAEQKAREDETRARQQAITLLRNETLDMVDKQFGSGTKLTADDQAFLQDLAAQTLVLARARNYVNLSQWDKASAEYARIAWSKPLADDAFTYASLFLIRGDSEGYHRFCDVMLGRAASLDGAETYVMARICAIARVSPVDPARVVKWANQGVSANHSPWDFHVLGLAQYRAGQLAEALESLTKANVKGWRYHELSWFALALVHYRLGHPDEARQCFDKGIEWLARVGPSGPDQPANLLPQDWLEAQLLRREAEELMTTQPSP